MRSNVSAQNFGKQTKATLTLKDKKLKKPKPTKQKTKKKPTKPNNPKQQKPPQANQTRKHLFTEVFQNQSYVPLCLVLPEMYVIWRHVIRYDSNQPFPPK